MKKINKNYPYIIITICFSIFLVFMIEAFKNETMKCDVWAYNFFVGILRNNISTFLMKIITQFGSAFVLISICIILFIKIKNKKIPILVSLNLISVTLLNQIFKFLIQRPRPVGYRLVNETGYSFPSGHSMVSMAFYGYLIYLIFRYKKNKQRRNLLCFFLSILVLLVGISRIYLGVHYASDVMAGILLSTVYLIIFVNLTSNYLSKKR